MPKGIYKRTKEMKTGKHHKPMQGFQKGNTFGFQKEQCDEKHPSWKGDLAKQKAMHHWVVKHKGKVSTFKCVDCGKQARYWSNKDHSYKRILNDYSPRCASCHKIYDLHVINIIK